MDNKNTDLSFLRIDKNKKEEPSGTGRTKLFVAVGVLAVAAVLITLFSMNSSGSAETVELGVVALTTPAQESSILAASGYVVAQRKAAVASKGTGRLEFLGVIEGDRVRKGEVIGRLESSDVEAALGQAKAGLALARAGLESAMAEQEDASANFERQKALFGMNSISRAEYDGANARNRRAVAAVASAEANIKYAEANVRAAEVGVENTYIRAPFDGVVLTKNANVGEVISPFGAAAGSRGAIVTVADMRSLEVEADVSESNIEKLVEGQPCEITLDAYPDKRYPGRVNKIVPTADRAKATVLTKVKFDRLDERVLPEMRAKVNFVKEAKPEGRDTAPKLSVPASAVTERNGQKVVFVLTGETVTETAVTLGEVMGSRIEVRQGVSSGQKVVLRPAGTLATGARIAAGK
ncbi:MAG: efflux RND transporter periplasmic adaptor subunit [Bacteroidetes bacterium]|nr:MAG: efflux RND transporter periplasmic adaptor subunit [Bacteroidota bacterium]